MASATVNRTEIEGLEIAFRDEGDGPAVLLLHGWPTSSYLWRNVIPPIAGRNRVIAPDLPGFGASDKPLDRTYDFALHEAVIDGLLAELGIESTGVAVHDLGGPIGVHWTLANRERVTRLALLNTLLYPEFDATVIDFVTTLANPETRHQMTGPEGLAELFELGTADGSELSGEVLETIQTPFADEVAQIALANAGIQLPVEGFNEIAAGLPELEMPVRVVYGEQDKALPDVAKTMARVARDVPQAEVTSLPECGHFLQEERPEKVGELLAEFFSPASSPRPR